MLPCSVSERPGTTSDVVFLPDIFKAAIAFVVDNFDSPSRSIDSDGNRSLAPESVHRRTKLVSHPGFDLYFALINIR
jgi:hypothetical protein